MSSQNWPVLDEAHHALRTVTTGLSADQLGLATPCENWNVAQVVEHAAGDQIAYASTLTGGPGPDYDPFDPPATLDGSPADLVEAALATVSAAFATVDPADAEVAVPLPPFKVPAEMAVLAASMDAAIHAWDIAVATGRPSPLTPSLARSLRVAADALAEPLRGFAFGPAIEPAADADEVSSLLNYLGRRADWAA
jgi:uncharacterized protein (TIGR03086 family)